MMHDANWQCLYATVPMCGGGESSVATLDKQTTWAPSTNFCHPEVRDSIVVVLSSVPFQTYLLQSPTFTTQYSICLVKTDIRHRKAKTD